MDEYRGVTFQDWACGAANMSAGMPVEKVCEILGVSNEDWSEATKYWVAHMQTMMARDPKFATTYQSYFQNPQQGKFAAVTVRVRTLQELLPVVPNVDAYQALDAGAQSAANMGEYLKGYGLSLAEWGELTRYWAPKVPPPPAPEAPRQVASGMTEKSLKYFVKVGPGVFKLKKKLKLATIGMLLSPVLLVAVVALGLMGVMNVNPAGYLVLVLVAVAGLYMGLMEVLVKTVFDQNQRTVTGLISKSRLLKLKTTVSFDDFDDFYHVTSRRQTTQGAAVHITVETRLDMAFIVDGKKCNLTILSSPKAEAMEAVCNEITFLMYN